MTHKFAEIAFTPAVKGVQEEMGSRNAYRGLDAGEFEYNHRIGPDEAAFIAARDSFYMATVSETGWPYIQHRGGHPGFLQVIDDKTLGFIDYRGNRQYISVGNLRTNDKVSLFFMDYINKGRLKLLGRARIVTLEEADGYGLRIAEGYKARGERAFIIDVEGIDWNCPQHIHQRVDADSVRNIIQTLQGRIEALEKENAALKA